MLDNWCIAMENKESKSKYDYFDVTADIGLTGYVQCHNRHKQSKKRGVQRI